MSAAQITRRTAATLIAAVALAPAAHASGGWRFVPPVRAAAVPTASCPAGVPVQTITVTNLAHATTAALAAVERATTDQSMQIRAAWGTPCIRFGPGGWPLILTSGRIANPDGTTTYQLGGVHTGTASRHGATAIPTIDVQTGALPYKTWARAWTHEVAETLENPTASTVPGGPQEIADRVENGNATYTVDGLQVTDFVFPSFYTDGPGPFDQAHTLTEGI